MSEFLLSELGKRSLETVERVSRGVETEPLRPRMGNILAKHLENQLEEKTELLRAETKLKEARGWLERKEINPNYHRFAPYRVNCGSCAFALWRRLSGEDLDAKAVRNNVAPKNEDMELITGLTCVPSSPEEIEEMLRARGPGAHTIAGVNRFRGSGHWFNVFFDGKQVWNLDAQDGTISKWPRDYGDVASWDVLV